MCPILSGIERKTKMMDENEDTKNTELENEFKKLIETVGKQIAAKVAEADRLMDEAIELADEHGIPFYSSGISQLGQAYVPNSFTEKFSELDRTLVEELTDVSEYTLDEAYGWQHSQVCW